MGENPIAQWSRNPAKQAHVLTKSGVVGFVHFDEVLELQSDVGPRALQGRLDRLGIRKAG